MILPRRAERGFSLIELLIVVVIVGVLASIALPSYRNYVIRSGRAAAIADIQDLSLFLERAFTAQGRYDNVASPGSLANSLPFTTSPQDDANPRYSLAISGLSANNFVLRAIPVGGQTDDSACGELRTNEAGAQCIKGGAICSTSASAGEREAVASCW